MNNNTITLLSVEYDNERNRYNIKIPAGSNVAETAVCMTVVTKCLLRDGVIKSATEITDLINKYCDDPQYNEITGGNDDDSK